MSPTSLQFLVVLLTAVVVSAVPHSPVNPCAPSPCGPNGLCKVVRDNPVCTCIEGFLGLPPNCHYECEVNTGCPGDKACVNNNCRDPCPGSCGPGAVCNVVDHSPICSCPPKYQGDPFYKCVKIDVEVEEIVKPEDRR